MLSCWQLWGLTQLVQVEGPLELSRWVESHPMSYLGRDYGKGQMSRFLDS